MITDRGGDGLMNLSLPASGEFISSSFGTRAGPGGFLSSVGGQWGILVEVDPDAPAADVVGVPIYQFHIIASLLGQGVFLHSSADAILLGTYAPNTHIDSATAKSYVGLRTYQLQKGDSFIIRPQPWAERWARKLSIWPGSPGAAIAPETLVYIGVAVTLANSGEAGPPLGTGTFKAQMVTIGQETQSPPATIFPAGHKVIG